VLGDLGSWENIVKSLGHILSIRSNVNYLDTIGFSYMEISIDGSILGLNVSEIILCTYLLSNDKEKRSIWSSHFKESPVTIIIMSSKDLSERFASDTMRRTGESSISNLISTMLSPSEKSVSPCIVFKSLSPNNYDHFLLVLRYLLINVLEKSRSKCVGIIAIEKLKERRKIKKGVAIEC